MDTIKEYKGKKLKVKSPLTMNKVISHLDINSDWYKAIIQSSPLGYLLIDHKAGGAILDTNDAFCKMLGYSRDELLSMKVKDIEFGFDESLETIKKRISDIEETREASFEARHRRKDGKIINVAINLRYLDEGLSFCFHRNITEQKRKQKRERQNLKRTEENLKETEDRYRTLIELGTKIGEAVIMLQDIDGKEGMHTYFSDQWPEITGYSKEELLNLSFFDLVSPKYKKNSIQRHRQKMGGKAIPDLFELTILRKDGKEIPIEITSAVNNYKCEPTNVVYIRDITDRKLTERELKDERDRYITLFKSAPVALLEFDFSIIKRRLDKLHNQGVTDLEGYFDDHTSEFEDYINDIKIIGVNKAYIDLMGAKSIAEAYDLFYKYSQISKKDSRALIDNFIKLNSGLTKFTKEESIQAGKQRPRRVSTRFTIPPGYENNWSRVIVSLFDITELRKAELRLKEHQRHLEDIVQQRTSELKSAIQNLEKEIELRKKAEKAQAMLYSSEQDLRKELQNQMTQRIEFTRNLVHELKSPLTPLKVSTDYLVSNLIEEPFISFARNIQVGVDNLSKRIEELLDLARGEIGILRLKCERVEPMQLIQIIYDFILPEASSSQLSLTIEAPCQLPIIKADKGRIQQVLINLLSNAIKFTPRGGKVIIRASQKADNLVFEIEDTGYGVDKKTQKCLFEPYTYKRSRACRESLGGLGLGLAISKMLVELHGGKIWMVSEPGMGSIFSFSIPQKCCRSSSVRRKRKKI